MYGYNRNTSEPLLQRWRPCVSGLFDLESVYHPYKNMSNEAGVKETPGKLTESSRCGWLNAGPGLSHSEVPKRSTTAGV